MKKHIIYALGMGPGNINLLTPAAEQILKECDTIVGYTSYLNHFSKLFNGKTIISNGMRGEVERCKLALDATIKGEKVAVISSGDAGVYGMAGLLLELTQKEQYSSISVEVIPGITAANAAAAVFGAPLMNDYAVISLSNLMTPDDIILKRLKGVAAAGLVCVLYNPASKKRRELIEKCISIFSEHRNPETLIGIIKQATKKEQETTIVKIKDFPFNDINMNTLIIIGNDQTVLKNGKLYTLRGYSEKYKD
jgi:precorrin-3B C17-methyltransferase